MKNRPMDWILTAAMVLATLAGSAAAQTASGKDKNDAPSSLEKVIMDLQRQEDEAEIKRDAAALDRIFADDAIISLAMVVSKADLIKAIKETKQSDVTPTFKYDDVLVRRFGDTAVANYRVTFNYRDSAGKETNSSHRLLVVWAMRGNEWKAIAVQGMPL